MRRRQFTDGNIKTPCDTVKIESDEILEIASFVAWLKRLCKRTFDSLCSQFTRALSDVRKRLVMRFHEKFILVYMHDIGENANRSVFRV